MAQIEAATDGKSGKHKERSNIKQLRTTCKRRPGRFHGIPERKKLDFPEVQLITFLNVKGLNAALTTHGWKLISFPLWPGIAAERLCL